MSLERQRRLRRTVVVGVLAFLGVVWALSRAFGSEEPATAADRSGPGAASATSATSAEAPSNSGSGTSSGSASTHPASDPATVPRQGDGKLAMVAIPGTDTVRAGRTITFGVDAEGSLGIDTDSFAAQVRQILSDERGWEVADGVHFVAVTPAERAAGATPDIRVTLASPTLTDQLCAPLRTLGEVSCNRHGRAVINAVRWASGVEYYTDLDLYRTYLINHEVGHGLSHQHENCPAPGQKAPIMLQQTLGLQGCVAWPYPTTGD